MSQGGPRPVRGEDRDRGGGWIVRLLLGLLLLAVLVALLAWGCQALTGGGGEQGQQDQQDSRQQSSQQGGRGSGGNAPGGGGAPENASGGENTTASGSGGSGEQAQGRERISAQLASLGTQNVSGAAVTVPEASISGTGGWVAVYGEEYASGQQAPEPVGYAPLGEGRNANVEVPLERAIEPEQTLYAVVHAEQPADGRFTPAEGDPAVTENGEPVESSFQAPASDDLPETGGPALPSLAAGMLVAGALLLLANGLLRVKRQS